MAGVKVTDLNTLGTAAANDIFYIVDTASNESKQIEVGNVVNLQTAYDNGNTINGSNVIIEDSTGAGIVAIGELAADSNTGSDIVAIGVQAASGNTGDAVYAIGNKAALNNTGSSVFAIAGLQNNTGNDAISIGGGDNNSGDGCVFIGGNSGNDNTGQECVFIGNAAGQDNTGDDVMALGKNAGIANALSNQFIVSPSNMPSYADATAAATAKTVALGATAGDFYLYHDQSDDTIKAVIPV
jgi:hypothetical protein